jgi:small subunit ribosomal protein S16
MNGKCVDVFSVRRAHSARRIDLSVKIRLKRTGRKNRTSFRIVACDTRSSRDGEVLEMLGAYDPEGKTEEKKVQLKPERVEAWIRKGAQPTAIVDRILRRRGIKATEIRAKLRAEAAAKKAEASAGKPAAE